MDEATVPLLRRMSSSRRFACVPFSALPRSASVARIAYVFFFPFLTPVLARELPFHAFQSTIHGMCIACGTLLPLVMNPGSSGCEFRVRRPETVRHPSVDERSRRFGRASDEDVARGVDSGASGAMSWQEYVDEQLVDTGCVSSACIAGLDGVIWANQGLEVRFARRRRRGATSKRRDGKAGRKSRERTSHVFDAGEATWRARRY